MLLEPEETTRFYRVWFALLSFVNGETRLVKNWPARFGQGVKVEHAARLRNALWADDALAARFVSENPDGLSPEDLALVTRWKEHRVEAKFALLYKQFKKHAVVMTHLNDPLSPAPRAYAVLGLASAPGELVPETPLPVDIVLLPWEDKIIYDSILLSSGIFLGRNMRASLNRLWRDVQDGRGLITALPPDPNALRTNIAQGNARLEKAFRASLLGAGLSETAAARHADTVVTLADELASGDPPRPLIELDLDTARRFAQARPAGLTSLKRFARFLYDAERGDPERVWTLQEIRRRA